MNVIEKKIGAWELLKNCMTKKGLEACKASKILEQEGLYIVRYTYRCDGNPFGDQTVWILYDREGFSKIRKIFDHTKDKFQEWNGRLLIIDDFNPQHCSVPLEISLLSDGHVNFGGVELRWGEVKGCVGVVTGQGRYVDLDDDETLFVIHLLLAIALYSHLKEDPFIALGRERLEDLGQKLEPPGK